MPEPINLDLDLDEAATILAALRFYQKNGLGEPEDRPEGIHEIATNDGREVSLCDETITKLCERLRDHFDMHDDPVCYCQNCKRLWLESELEEIQDLTQRVDSGEPMPSGECPDCGALCQLLGQP